MFLDVIDGIDISPLLTNDPYESLIFDLGDISRNKFIFQLVEEMSNAIPNFIIDLLIKMTDAIEIGCIFVFVNGNGSGKYKSVVQESYLRLDLK
jgi:hypothetical protein